MSTERLYAFRFAVMHTRSLCQSPVLVLIKAPDEVKALSDKCWPTLAHICSTCVMTTAPLGLLHAGTNPTSSVNSRLD